MQGEACKPYRKHLTLQLQAKEKQRQQVKFFLAHFASCECKAQQSKSTVEHARTTLVTQGASCRGGIIHTHSSEHPNSSAMI